MKKITMAWMEEKEPCESQMKLFKKLWPKGGKITLANLKKAATQGFELNWLANKILKAPALKLYDESKATTLKLYPQNNPTTS